MNQPFIIRFKNKLKGGNKTEFATIYAETEKKALNTFKANFNMVNTEIIEVKSKLK